MPASKARSSGRQFKLHLAGLIDNGGGLKHLKSNHAAIRREICDDAGPDLVGVPVVRPRVTETTALGTAYLAGLAVRFWKDEKEIAAHWQRDREFRPKIKPASRRKLLAGWSAALERARG